MSTRSSLLKLIATTVLAATAISPVSAENYPTIDAAQSFQPLPNATFACWLGYRAWDWGGVVQPWLSNHQLLNYGNSYQLFSYDIDSKFNTPLLELTRRLDIEETWCYWIHVSPDGKWLSYGMEPNSAGDIVSITGKNHHEWADFYGFSQLAWYPGTGRAAVLLYHPSFNKKHHDESLDPADARLEIMHQLPWLSAHIYDMSQPGKQSQSIQLSPNMKGLYILGISQNGSLIARTPDALHERNPKPVFTFEIPPNYDPLVPIFRADQEIGIWPIGADKPSSQYAIHCPQLVESVRLSPKADQFAWIMTDKPGGTQSIWVSRVDGSEMREIGQVQPNSDEQSDGYDRVSNINWSPDETRLSFEDFESLYVLPVTGKVE